MRAGPEQRQGMYSRCTGVCRYFLSGGFGGGCFGFALRGTAGLGAAKTGVFSDGGSGYECSGVLDYVSIGVDGFCRFWGFLLW